MNWNMFDLWVWVFSYVCIGMLRKTIFILNAERTLLINDYSYNYQVAKFLINSIRFAGIALPLSIALVVSAHIVFMGTMERVISILCFPSIMLAIDSIFLILSSWRTQQHLVYFFNQNISGMSPIYLI
jgi:hypothetical protein